MQVQVSLEIWTYDVSVPYHTKSQFEDANTFQKQKCWEFIMYSNKFYN